MTDNNLTILQDERRRYVEEQAAASSWVENLQHRLADIRAELTEIDTERKVEFATKLLNGEPTNIDHHIWRKLQLEAEFQDLPYAIEILRKQIEACANAIAAVESKITVEHAIEQRRNIEELMNEGRSREEVRQMLSLSASEFDKLTPPAGETR